MAKKRLSTIGLEMPEDFDAVPYEAIHSRVVAWKDTCPDAYAQYAGAWNAVAYRFMSCAEHDAAFTKSIQQGGDAPPPPERYIQERELFSFFVTGLIVIESFCFGLFAIASMVDSENFPIKTAKDLRFINLQHTVIQFTKAFPEEGIAITLRKTLGDDTYKEWKEIRNILAHRAAPGRTIYVPTRRSAPAALWKVGIQLDENTTFSRRKWLATIMDSLLRETDNFTARSFS